jgi:hypothetical protein
VEGTTAVREYFARWLDLPNESYRGRDGERTGVPPCVLPDNERVVQLLGTPEGSPTYGGVYACALIERTTP